MDSQTPAAAQAQTNADILDAAGVRSADVLQTAGVRDAAVLASAGDREAATLRVAGQRRINLLWEYTQAAIAIMVTITTLSVATYKIIAGQPLAGDGPFLLLSNTFFLVVGTYFQRTNHTKTGGVGMGDIGR